MTTQDNPGATDIKQRVIETLKTVYDPEIPVDIYELGLVYKIDVETDGKVKIEMTLTSPACPVAESLPIQVEDQVNQIDGVSSVKVDITWEPTWNPEMMSEAARLTLGF